MQIEKIRFDFPLAFYVLHGQDWVDYEGDVDQDGYACGEGTATSKEATFTGTWYKNKMHGVRMYI